MATYDHNIQTVDAVADLANVSLVTNQQVKTLGYYAPSDGGGNTYRYDAGSSASCDGGLVLDGIGGDNNEALTNASYTGTGVGRFIAIDQVSVKAEQFGANLGLGAGPDGFRQTALEASDAWDSPILNLEGAADPTTVELPNDRDASFWKNATSGKLLLAVNDDGTIKLFDPDGGGGLTNWEENGTTLRPVVAGYDLGETGQRAGAIYGQTIDLSGIAQAGAFFSDTPQTVESQSQVGLYLTGAGSGVIRTYQANTPYLYVIQSTGKSCRISHENIGWGPSTAPDARLYRIEANHLGMFNGVNPQSFSLYNTYADVSNFERGGMRWDTNALVIGTEAAGTGSSRDVHIKNLPTSNPGPGILWNNAGTPAIGT